MQMSVLSQEDGVDGRLRSYMRGVDIEGILP
jgi:hypothetical protein